MENEQIKFVQVMEQDESEIPPHPKMFKDKSGFDLTINDIPSKAKLVSQFIKKITKQIYHGRFNIITLQKPALITSHYTQMQLMAEDLNYLCAYCHEAFQANDHFEKLKIIVSGVFGLLTNGFLMTEGKAPIGAEIGETFNGENEMGDKLYLEIVRTNPFRTFFEIYSKDNEFKIWGEHIVQLKKNTFLT